MTQRGSATFGERAPASARGNDAVIIVPGIMGSELTEANTGRVIWGAGAVAANVARLGYRQRMRSLAVSDDERAGRTCRVVPTGLLAVPDWAYGLGGFEPYRDLVSTAREALIHPDGVLEFGYDWRLSVEHNARLLARAARKHLDTWRSHPAVRAMQDEYQDERSPRLVFVAHSMGGLLVRAMVAADDEPLDIRAVLTLGTPFEGSAKALEFLAHGRGAPVPLPAEITRDVSRTMPGVYDLLPGYRCRLVDDDVVSLSPQDIAQVGGERELAEEAFARRRRVTGVPLPGHVAVVGTSQLTTQTVELRDGVINGHAFGYRRHADGELVRDGIGRLCREDHGGDGTVFRHAARLPGVPETGLAQQHAALVRARSALDLVWAVLTGVDDLGSVLGGAAVGLDVPDLADPAHPLPIRITGDVDPARTSCAIEDVGDHDRVVSRPLVSGRPVDGALVIQGRLPRPGLFRIRVAAGGDPVTKLVLAGVADGLDG
jgi:Lecithin:cholesterol acyltransferase